MNGCYRSDQLLVLQLGPFGFCVFLSLELQGPSLKLLAGSQNFPCMILDFEELMEFLFYYRISVC